MVKLKSNAEKGCLFCRWIQEKEAVEILGSVAAFEDGYPVTDGHLLIVPLRHAPDWFALSDQELRDIDGVLALRNLGKPVT